MKEEEEYKNDRPGLFGLVTNNYSSNLILQFLGCQTSKYLSPAQRTMLKCGPDIVKNGNIVVSEDGSTSAKQTVETISDLESRRVQLLAYVMPHLLTTIEKHTSIILSSQPGSLVIRSLLAAKISDTDRSRCCTAIVECLKKEPKLIQTSIIASRCLKHCLLDEKIRTTPGNVLLAYLFR